MQKYGILDNEGNLSTSSKQIDEYKPVVYAEIPEAFDQTTHYVVQSNPIDKGDYIFVGVETHVLEIEEDEEFDEDVL